MAGQGRPTGRGPGGVGLGNSPVGLDGLRVEVRRGLSSRGCEGCLAIGLGRKEGGGGGGGVGRGGGGGGGVGGGAWNEGAEFAGASIAWCQQEAVLFTIVLSCACCCRRK